MEGRIERRTRGTLLSWTGFARMIAAKLLFADELHKSLEVRTGMRTADYAGERLSASN